MRLCDVADCFRKHKGKGYCKLHYERWRKSGDPLVTRYHGKSNTAEYRAWCHMKDRCNNPNNDVYHHYGGRGIKVCSEWSDFRKFYADMGDSNGLTLERIDNNGNYELDNCRWATSLDQILNRRNNSNNTSGYRGVSWDKRKNTWYAQASLDYKHVFLGYFDDPKEASKAYLKFNKERRSIVENLSHP